MTKLKNIFIKSQKKMIKEIKFDKIPRFGKPDMIAAWPGIGYVASESIRYLMTKLKAESFAEIEPRAFFPYNYVNVKDGISSFPVLPIGRFYYSKNLIIFVAEAQPSGKDGDRLARIIIGLAKKFGVKRIYTAAAFPIPMDYRERPKVWGVVNKKKLLDCFRGYKINILKDGSISGLNGTLMGFAKESSIDSICLLGEIPIYTANIENPKAALCILEVLTRMLNIEIDLKTIEKKSERIEKEVGKELEQLYAQMREKGRLEPEIIKEFEKIPYSARQRIEEFFKIVERDKTKAMELKRELDKWALFEEYEDRFLDLFKKRNE